MPVVAHVVIPPAGPTRPPVPEAVLDSRPARAAQPGAGPVQGIVLQLPEDSGATAPFPAITMTFRMDAPDLVTEVAETADLAFVASGTPGLKAFNDALRGTTRAVHPLAPLFPVPTEGEDRYISDDRTPQRGRLIQAFEGYLERLPSRRAAAEAAVEKAALEGALRRLELSRTQLVAEARRYLSLANPSSAPDVLSGSGPTKLTGPETLDLVADLIAIGTARIELARRAVARREAVQRWEREKLGILEDDRTRAGVHRTYVTDAQLREQSAALAAMGDSREVADAKRRVADQHEALTQLVTGLAAGRSLLFRLWDTEVPFLALRLIKGSRGGPAADRARVIDSRDLRDAVVARLRTAYQAATELIGDLKSDPDLVWRFEPLIEDTLSGLNAGDSDFAARAARERVKQERPGVELAEWSKWLGFAQLGFALSGAAPVATAFMVAQAAVDIGGVVVKAFAAAQQQLGEDAFLRPSARLGVPPSYSGPVMDALDVAIGVLTPLPFDTKFFREP
jgi:hypothetical protein